MKQLRIAIDADDFQQLEALANARSLCKQDIVAEAIANYLSDHRIDTATAGLTAGLMASFGVWKDQAIDGVEYQRKMREEW